MIDLREILLPNIPDDNEKREISEITESPISTMCSTSIFLALCAWLYITSSTRSGFGSVTILMHVPPVHIGKRFVLLGLCEK